MIDAFNILTSLGTTIATIVAAICAYCAYKQAFLLRKYSSFDALFSQKLIILSNIMNNECLRKTNLMSANNNIVLDDLKFEIIKDQNVFLSFCDVYKEYVNIYSILEKSQITKIWTIYTNSLSYRANYLNCFKFIYYMVDVVMKSPLKEHEKSNYIGIIQAQLNLDFLFCYLINLIVYNKKEYNDQLKRYDFFRNLFNDQAYYGKIISDTIPDSILKQF